MDPMTILSGLGGLGGLGGGTKVKTNTNTSVATQLSLALNNQIGAGSSSPSGGSNTAPVTQSAADNEGAYPLPVFGANQSANPSADLNSLLTGNSGGVAAVAGSKAMLVTVAAGIAAVAVFFGLKGRK